MIRDIDMAKRAGAAKKRHVLESWSLGNNIGKLGNI
jgi:hypothetical protein